MYCNLIEDIFRGDAMEYAAVELEKVSEHNKSVLCKVNESQLFVASGKHKSVRSIATVCEKRKKIADDGGKKTPWKKFWYSLFR